MQVYDDRTFTESFTEQWSRTGGDPGHLGRVDDPSDAEPRPWQHLRVSVRRLLNRLLRRPAERTSQPEQATSQPDVCHLCLYKSTQCVARGNKGKNV